MTERICQKNKASYPNFQSLFPAVSKKSSVSSREDFICGLLCKWLNRGQSIMVLFGERVLILAGFLEVSVPFCLPLLPVLCNVSVYMNMTFICFSRIKKLLIEKKQNKTMIASHLVSDASCNHDVIPPDLRYLM